MLVLVRLQVVFDDEFPFTISGQSGGLSTRANNRCIAQKIGPQHPAFAAKVEQIDELLRLLVAAECPKLEWHQREGQPEVDLTGIGVGNRPKGYDKPSTQGWTGHLYTDTN